MKQTLYKRNAQGKILSWAIEQIGSNTISLEYGLFDGNKHLETYGTNKRPIEKEFKSRYDAKRKEGYKSLEDLRDNSPAEIKDTTDLRVYLETYLPKVNTDISGEKFCMLAKTLEDGKPFTKNTYDGQWKINGERCLIGAKKSNDMFTPVTLTYKSRHGTDWTSILNWMDDILLPCINQELLDMMIEEGVKLDGELYIPGFAINDINHIIKNPASQFHKALQYWCYDIAVESMSAICRHTMLESYVNAKNPQIVTLEQHLNNKCQFLVLPNQYIKDFNDAVYYRDEYISIGFEGLVIRDDNAEYQFGNKRNLSMLKFKKIYDGYFKVVAIEPQSKRNELPLFILRNDINSETFECTINATQDAQKYYMANADNFIGKEVFVEYRERSGVKEVPFHAKIIRFRTEKKPNTSTIVTETSEKPIVIATKDTIKQKKIKLKL